MNVGRNSVYKTTEQIRQLAKEDKITVLRGNKQEDWKNKLINLITDDVIRIQLQYLQPFMFYKAENTANCYSYRLICYDTPIYVKINFNKDIDAVVSFHYSQPNNQCSVRTMTNYGDDYLDTMSYCDYEKYGSELLIDIIPERREHCEYYLYLAYGDTVSKSEIIPLTTSYETKAMYLDNYIETVEEVRTETVKSMLRKIKNIIVRETDIPKKEIQQVAKDQKYLNILSCIDNSAPNPEQSLQIAGFCYNLYTYQLERPWLRTVAASIILNQPDKIQKQFFEQLLISQTSEFQQLEGDVENE